MADSYIVPPISIEDDATRIFYEQICDKLNTGITDTSGLEEEVSDIDNSLGGDALPDDVSGVIATGGYANIRLTFLQPSYDGHSYTIFIRATDGNINNAIAVGTTSTDVFVDSITEPESTTTYTYWAKNVNVYGIDSLNYSSPASAVLGVDFQYSVDVLAGKLGYDEFDSANGVYPVRTEDVLPTLPDALYPINSTILLTTNQKLYTNRSGVWRYKIEQGDLETDAVTADSIETNSIVAGKIAAGALVVDDGVMNTGYIKTALIDNLAVTSAKITSLDVTKLNAGTIDVAIQLNAATIEAGIIKGGTITGPTLQTSTGVGGVTGDKSGIKLVGDTLYVYDVAGNIRVKLGDLS